jgi:hypothetical protein
MSTTGTFLKPILIAGTPYPVGAATIDDALVSQIPRDTFVPAVEPVTGGEDDVKARLAAGFLDTGIADGKVPVWNATQKKYIPGTGPVAASDITDASATGISVLTGTQAQGRTALGVAASSTPQFARIGIGSASSSTAGIYLTSANTGGTSVYGIYAAPNIKSDVTTRYSSVTSAPSTQATEFNLATLYHFFCTQGAVGDGSTIGEQGGFVVSSGLTGATNNYAFRSAIDAGTGRWNLYMDGTAVNYLAGNLGLGVTAPTAQFHTTGTVRFAGFGAGTLETDSSGNVTASSDASLKTVTGSFTRGLADVLKLTPRTYHWNEKSGMNTEDENVGFIAQEVLTAVPEAVGQFKTMEVEDREGKKSKKREAAEILTLSDRPLIAALVNAVKELKAENDALLARVSALENGKAAK